MTSATDTTADADFFQTFATGEVVTNPADEIPDLLDAISDGKIPAEQVIEWWSVWGKRMHDAILAWNGLPANQRAEIAERFCAEGDYEARVLILEGAVAVS